MAKMISYHDITVGKKANQTEIKTVWHLVCELFYRFYFKETVKRNRF